MVLGRVNPKEGGMFFWLGLMPVNHIPPFGTINLRFGWKQINGFMAYKFIATRLTRVEAEALERILKRRRETIYSLLRLLISSYIKLADPEVWKDERPPIDLMRYIIEGTRQQREAMRAAAQEEELHGMFNDIRYEREKRKS